ncbi:MAG: coat protein, partial [Firmicutes bacterium]|nr:coat protein [Bacillota bacterium]
ARKMGWVKSYGANALSAMLSGDDPMGAIADLFRAYWSRQHQQMLLSILDGVFASNTIADRVHDNTALTGGKEFINGRTSIDATQKMGDAKELLTGVMLHSAVEAFLAKNDLIEYKEESQGKTEVPYFLGRRVIVDDAMTFDTVTGSAKSYLFGAGAVAWGNGSHPDIFQTEVVRQGLSLAGEDVLVNRRLPLLHPRGVKWTESIVAKTFPNFEELENGTNWERVYEPKAVRVVKFVFKIDE